MASEGGGTQKGPASPRDLNAVTSVVEAHRIVALLEKSIDRLQLLSLLNYDSYDANSADKESAGMDGVSGVGTILDNQKRMERRYDELLRATAKVKRNPLDPSLDFSCFASIDDREYQQHKEELERVSQNLKEYSRDLCRQLKENPNDSNNWNKVVNGRTELMGMLQSCVREMTTTGQASGAAKKAQEEGISTGFLDETGSQAESQRSGRSMQAGGGGVASYEVFAVKVIEEQNEQIWADDIVKREKETNQNVKTLQNEVAMERGMKERELEERQQQLSELKIKVRKLRQESAENYERKKGETEARAEAQARRGKNRQRELKELIETLKERIEVEKQVNEQLRSHLTHKIDEIAHSIKDWSEKQTDRQRQMEEGYQNDKKAKEQLETKLHDAMTMASAEKQKRDMRRELDEKEKQQRKREEDLEAAKREASTRLQAAFKAYLVRQQLAASKKGKKKKKK